MSSRLMALVILWIAHRKLKKYQNTHKVLDEMNKTILKWRKLLGIQTKRDVNARRISKLIERGKWAQSIYYKKVYCLPRSIGLGFFLILNGIDAKINIGVRIDPPRKFHAWVEVNDKPISDLKERIFEYKTIMKYEMNV